MLPAAPGLKRSSPPVAEEDRDAKSPAHCHLIAVELGLAPKDFLGSCVIKCSCVYLNTKKKKLTVLKGKTQNTISSDSLSRRRILGYVWFGVEDLGGSHKGARHWHPAPARVRPKDNQKWYPRTDPKPKRHQGAGPSAEATRTITAPVVRLSSGVPGCQSEHPARLCDCQKKGPAVPLLLGTQ